MTDPQPHSALIPEKAREFEAQIEQGRTLSPDAPSSPAVHRLLVPLALGWLAFTIAGVVWGASVTANRIGSYAHTWLFYTPPLFADAPKHALHLSHQVAAALLGVCTLVLMGWIILRERGVVRALAAACLTAVLGAGLMGGLRTLAADPQDPTLGQISAVIHGSLGAANIALGAALVVCLCQAFRLPRLDVVPKARRSFRRARAFSGALISILILQGVLGSAFALFSISQFIVVHIATAVIVVGLSLATGFTCIGAGHGIDPSARRHVTFIGRVLLITVLVQVVLGILALAGRGDAPPGPSPVAVLGRLLHAANACFIVAAASAAWVWSRRLAPVHHPRQAQAVARPHAA